MKATTKAHFAVLGTNLFFAANFSLVKLLSPRLVGPFAVNILRVALSLVLFWTAWLFGKTPAGIRKEHIGRFVLCALTGVAINQMLFIKGLTLTTTIHASLLMLVTPIVVTLFALWMLNERFTLFKGLGLCLGIAGSFLLISQRETSQHATNYLLGDIFILVNAVSYSVYFIIVKPLMKEYSPLHVIRWAFTIGLFMMLPFGWKEMHEVQWEMFEWQHYAALFFVVFTGTFLAYYFNAYGIQHIGAGATGTYIYTQPVFAVVIATLFLEEHLGWQKVAAAVLIFLGVFLVSFRKQATT